MSLFLDLLNLAVYLPFLKPDEEDISRNLNELKKHQWFKDYYQDERYLNLIIHDSKVRKVIGRFNTNKIKNPSYPMYCQNKLNHLFNKTIQY